MDGRTVDEINISAGKTKANVASYFGLFDKYLPMNLTPEDSILILGINNPGVIREIIMKNPVANYVIYDEDDDCALLQMIFNDENQFTYISANKYTYDDLWDILSGKKIYNKKVRKLIMKFKHIIMNPPYNKNLHLKILEKAITYLKDDDSVCVNLSPIRWLQDPLAKYKKRCDYYRFEDSVAKHITDLNIIKQNHESELFSAQINTDLAIYICKINGNYDYANEWTKNVNVKHFNAIKNYWKFPKLLNYDETNPTWFVPVKIITNPYRSTAYNICCNIGIINNGKCQDGKYYRDAMYKSKTFSNDRELRGVYFDTYEEANNFYNSTMTNVYKYFCSMVMVDVHIHPEFLPWMGDVINPRTGKKGYESEWTDEYFYTYFNITEEEQKVIEETMAAYK